MNHAPIMKSLKCPAHRAATMTKSAGFSLTELMIAMVIGVTLMGGVLQVAVSSKTNHVVGEELTRLQESGRFAIDVLSDNIREAGYVGFAIADGSITPTVTANPAPAFPFDSANMLTGHSWNGSSWFPSAPANSGSLGTVVANTDLISIQHGSSCGGQLIKGQEQPNNPIKINQANTCNINDGDVLVISDYSNIDIFRVTSTNNTGAAMLNIVHTVAGGYNTSGFLGNSYSADSEILKAQSSTYFIRNGANGSPSLWRFHNNTAAGSTNPEELVEGVEDMAILYGVNTDAVGTTGYGTANQYLDANTVSIWEDVVSVRLALLLKTSSDILDSPQDYTFLAGTANTTVAATAAVTPSDNAVRRTFSTTIQIRNRGLE